MSNCKRCRELEKMLVEAVRIVADTEEKLGWTARFDSECEVFCKRLRAFLACSAQVASAHIRAETSIVERIGEGDGE